MILDELAAYAKIRVNKDKSEISFEKIKRDAYALPKGSFIFENALKKDTASIICEVKKASPSKGVISEDFPYLSIAKSYEYAGATCISVLTEPKWFLGSDSIFQEIRQFVSLPMLRKDFTVDPYQIYQAKVFGADAVLLICALLDTDTIKEYLQICDTLGISALVETHNAEEIDSAVCAGARIIGVNNRNLHDFSEDLSTAPLLKEKIPKDVLFIAESGIKTPEDGISLFKSGANALLIGEAIMKCDNISTFIQELRSYSYDKN
jgi:indole-3-glycerol phosphate synthase